MSVFDRWHVHFVADWIRRLISIDRTERALSRILDTRFRFVVTEIGGSAIDVDTEAEYDAIQARFDEWSAIQRERAESIVGPLPLAAVTDAEQEHPSNEATGEGA